MKKHRLKIISCIVALGIIVTSFPGIAAVDDLPSHIGLWTFDDDVLTESVGKYAWDTPIVTSPDSHPITPAQTGVIGQAWRIQKRDHIDEGAAGISLGTIPSALVGAKKFAISMWINPMKFESYQTAFYIKASPDIGICNARFENNVFAPRILSDTADASTRYTVSDNTFHHLVTVFDFTDNNNCSFSFYMDGVLIGSRSNGILGRWFACENGLPESAELYIGSDCNNARSFNGLIDELRFYENALTAEQVSALYDSYRIQANASDLSISMHTYNALDTNCSSIELELTNTEFAEMLTPAMFATEGLPQGLYIGSVTRLTDRRVSLSFTGASQSLIEQDTDFNVKVLSSAVTCGMPESLPVKVLLKAARKMYIDYIATETNGILSVAGNVENCWNLQQDAQLLMGLYSSGQMVSHRIIPISGLVSGGFYPFDEEFEISGLNDYKLCIYVWDALPDIENNTGSVSLADVVVYDKNYISGTGNVEIIGNLKGSVVAPLLVTKNINGENIPDYFAEIIPNADGVYVHSYTLFRPVEGTRYMSMLTIAGTLEHKDFIYYTDGYRLECLNDAKEIEDFEEFSDFMIQNVYTFNFDFSETSVYATLTVRGKECVWKELQKNINSISDIPSLIAAFNMYSDEQRILDKLISATSSEQLDLYLKEENGRLELTLNEDYEKIKDDVTGKLLGNTWGNIEELTGAFNDSFLGILFSKIDYTNRTLMLTKLKQYQNTLDIPDKFFGAKSQDYTKQMMGITYNSTEQIKEKAIAAIRTVDNSGNNVGNGGGGVSSPSRGGSTSSAGKVVMSSPEENHISSPIVTTEQATDPFPDLADVAWARESIRVLSQKGVINGTENGLFLPNDSVTRAEFAAMVVRAFNIETMDEEATSFADVLKDDWYYMYVNAVSQKGIVLGKGDNYFGANEPITRADISVILYRLLRNDSEEITGGSAFADESEIPEYALDAVRFVKEKGIASGVGENRFAPLDYCTRAMTAKIIYNALKVWEEV